MASQHTLPYRATHDVQSELILHSPYVSVCECVCMRVCMRVCVHLHMHFFEQYHVSV